MSTAALPGQQRGQQTPAPRTPQQQAPIDLTGWWVSVVTEDWRWRMVTPPKGDYASLPLNDEARKVADEWDPARDEREGNACKAYGGAAIMRMPTRLHVTWQDANTLKIDTDAGTQTRLLRFGDPSTSSGQAAPTEAPSWQGRSKATWEFLGQVQNALRGAGGGFGGGGGGGANAPGGGGVPAAALRFGSLKVVTDRLKAGYVRKNGVPYSENALVTEFFDRHKENNGDEWLTVTTIVDDPKYFNSQYVTSSGFKKEADGSKWRATPCSAK